MDKLLYATIDEIKNVIETKIFLQECLLDEFEKAVALGVRENEQPAFYEKLEALRREFR